MDCKLYDGLNIQLVPYFDSEKCIFIVKELEKEIVYLPAELCRVFVRNQFYNVARKMAVYGEDETLTYTFSGNTYRAKPWTNMLTFLRNVAFELTGEWYNLVVVNRYKDGYDKIGSHKDDEPDMDPNACIVSFSFGAERQFIFKRPHFPNYEVTLPSGSVFIMKPPTNKYWFHELPEQENVKDVRINLTFRLIRK
ncbi:unnamed protein product [Larinioides sclopetarius]|uniref:Fe2OG dioxygenase domain-containing protein n=1 Tax=Larinioides sclopetarius TaxID=280406 RepID=A0AAV2C2N3_9ARAC